MVKILRSDEEVITQLVHFNMELHRRFDGTAGVGAELSARVEAILYVEAGPADFKSWRCFHCDELFTSHKEAADHFGLYDNDTPACKLRAHEKPLVSMIRKLEMQLDSYRLDDTDLMRSIYSLETDIRTIETRAEERGYNKGVADMKKQGYLIEKPVDATQAHETPIHTLHHAKPSTKSD